ncbi:DUF2071 domain-containing protein [Tumebacillus sp. ITR2]|uniref:DUF2071 domain-containing protein n=1 Tax=Tumebacillus amylolyticus TaxID=2801339 RepID=A0ABS1J6U7_9BACL|nr:DUF2071 domain-containing protein [Tumebacillus amylolyticus]MBL0386001.1 DUF2071 domain-containing protein [Tumebacillus amylolyticus]
MSREVDQEFNGTFTEGDVERHKPWTMLQDWENLCFLHYAFDPEALRPHIPKGMELDVYEGRAYVSVVPFYMKRIRLRLEPDFLSMHFGELNLRTYVVVDGRPGVYFFSIDADSWLGSVMAKLMYHLPYYDASISLEENDGVFEFHNVRGGDGPAANFSCTYRPTSDVFMAEAGSLHAWLTERFSLFSTDEQGSVFRGDIEHGKWPLQHAEVEIQENQLFEAAGLPQPLEGPKAYFAKEIVTHCWPLERIK